MKNSTKIFFLIAFIAFFLILESVKIEAQEESATIPSLPPEVQAAIEAQSNLEIETQNFDVNFSPERPGANTRVSAEFISFTFDVNRSIIAWIINGKVAGSGKTFSFTTGELGSVVNLTVSAITPDKKTLSKSFTFQAAEVDILWETPGYTPPQYRGKALAIAQSFIKLTAIPQGIKTSASKLIYEWKRNGKNFPLLSGAGKKTFSFYGAEVGDEIVELLISTPEGSVVAENSVRIKINEPKILFYEESPLEGPLYQRELGSAFSLNKPELILRAEPYFFSKRALPILSYEWLMNNKKVATPQKPNLLNLAAPSGQKGTSIIALALENIKNVLERANKIIQVNFDVQ
jgi:hypothetical protein